MAQRSTPGTFSVPLNEDLRQRLTARAAELSKSVNDGVEEAVEQWLEVTGDDPSRRRVERWPNSHRSGLGPRLASNQPSRFRPRRLSCFGILNGQMISLPERNNL
jgi:hypothetical protein